MVSYTYDSWGKLISIKDQNGTDITNVTTHVGYKNPYRYRGYRYDVEIGLYYLQSRYYNSDWGGFLNLDETLGRIGQLLSHNLFSYCRNNPISRIDSNGKFDMALGGGASVGLGILFDIAPGVVIIGGIGYGLYKLYQYCTSNSGNSDDISNVSDTNNDNEMNQEDVFPDNPDDLFPDAPRKTKVKSNGTVSTEVNVSERVRIRAEKHPVEEGETFNPRHHGQHYHVEERLDTSKSWNNKGNVIKKYPNGYTKGSGSGFLPGEDIPIFP